MRLLQCLVRGASGVLDFWTFLVILRMTLPTASRISRGQEGTREHTAGPGSAQRELAVAALVGNEVHQVASKAGVELAVAVAGR